MVENKLPSTAEIVVIGGGVVGCSILYHLAKLGCGSAVLLERQELTSGSSWHAAGQIHTISSDPNISRLQGYTIRLYEELESLSGQSVGLHSTGGFYLASTRDWYDYLKRERSKARSMGLDQEFISLEEVSRLHPLIDSSHYIAALWDPLDGDIDPSGVTYAYAKAAKVLGGDYFTHTVVLETNCRVDGSWDVVTNCGTIHAERIVNAAGLWAREVGLLAGLSLPLQPMEHHYLVTESIPEVESLGVDRRLPAGIDYEANIYFRQERSGMLLGTYEPTSTAWSVSGTPLDFGHELLPPDIDRIAERLELGFERIPALGRVGIKNMINGPFTFGPDGNPLIGPVVGLRNYWVAVGVMAGFCQAGGVGKCMAEWMLGGEPEIDVWAMDVARFGDYASPSWGTVKASENYERRFVMTFPNETLPRGRCQKTTSLYDRLLSMGGVFGDSHGLEHVLWLSGSVSSAHETPTFHRSESHDYVCAEVRSVRESVGVIEVANFAKHHFGGADSYRFLDYVCAGGLPSAGRLSLTPLLTAGGRLCGDLSVACLGADDFYIFGSGAAQIMHRRWFESCMRDFGGDVIYENVSDSFHGLALSGPNSRELLSRLVRESVSADDFGFCNIRHIFVGGVPALCVRISFSGELGYEIYVAPCYQLRLFEAICEAGVDLGLRVYGSRALMSLRLEKGWGAWGMDYRPDFTAGQSGLDAFISWDKDFIGRDAALSERESGYTLRLVSMVLGGGNTADVVGDEAIMRGDVCVGYVTSGGYAHYVDKSVAMGYVPVDLAVEGMELGVEILGTIYPAIVTLTPLYDPSGSKMRG